MSKIGTCSSAPTAYRSRWPSAEVPAVWPRNSTAALGSADWLKNFSRVPCRIIAKPTSPAGRPNNDVLVTSAVTPVRDAEDAARLVPLNWSYCARVSGWYSTSRFGA
ncbi:hypothetical protein D3C72_2200810 [compost metagenome]